jgi:predicted DNA-binding ribbon-helix-helix protein
MNGEFLILISGAAVKSTQLPDDVCQRAAELAEADHVSVDRLVAAIVNERASDWAELRARAARGPLEKLRNVLAKVSDGPPEAIDRL